MEHQQEGVSVVLSPIQLAAILNNGTITAAETVSNRLWGGVNIVFGVIELMGAGALCAAPDPTMVTKAGCVVVGVHGLDSITTGARQLASGQREMSSTQHAASETAKMAGALPQAAQNISLGVDIAVALPFGMAQGAIKVASVNGGVFKLSVHEARAGSRIGGHTIERHVGKTEVELRARVAKEGIDVASSFHNLATAEYAISSALKFKSTEIKQWSSNALARQRPKAFDCDLGDIIGHGVVKATGQFVQMKGVRVVLKYETHSGMPYYILTAHTI